MSGGARPLYPAIIFLGATFLAAYAYIEGFIAEDESRIAELTHLWRPVLISIAIYALIRLIIAQGSAGMIRTLGDMAAGIAVWVG